MNNDAILEEVRDDIIESSANDEMANMKNHIRNNQKFYFEMEYNEMSTMQPLNSYCTLKLYQKKKQEVKH